MGVGTPMVHERWYTRSSIWPAPTLMHHTPLPTLVHPSSSFPRHVQPQCRKVALPPSLGGLWLPVHAPRAPLLSGLVSTRVRGHASIGPGTDGRRADPEHHAGDISPGKIIPPEFTMRIILNLKNYDENAVGGFPGKYILPGKCDCQSQMFTFLTPDKTFSAPGVSRAVGRSIRRQTRGGPGVLVRSPLKLIRTCFDRCQPQRRRRPGRGRLFMRSDGALRNLNHHRPEHLSCCPSCTLMIFDPMFDQATGHFADHIHSFPRRIPTHPLACDLVAELEVVRGNAP